MSAEVINLPGVAPGQEPCDIVIAAIERLLAEARTGQIRSILFVIVDSERVVTPGLATSGEHSHEFVSGALRLLRLAEKQAFGDV